MFDESSCNNDLKKIDSIKIIGDSSVEDIFINALYTHAPVKTKIVRASNHEFMTKPIRKLIMTRSRLKNLYLKNQNTIKWK